MPEFACTFNRTAFDVSLILCGLIFFCTGPGDLKPHHLNKKRESVISTAATMRVLNVLRHWVSKHNQVRGPASSYLTTDNDADK